MSEETAIINSGYHPTIAQLERTKRLRTFNWLFVYTPIIVGALVIVGLVGFMLWSVLQSPESPTFSFLSGLADIILILILIPLLIFGLIFGPLALGGLIYWLMQIRKKRQEDKTAVSQGILIQRYSWQIESKVDEWAMTFSSILAKIAQPIIQLNSWLAYIERFIKRLSGQSPQE